MENFDINPKALHGISVIITAGPTIEAIDPVRYISNYSSGKQGYEIAKTLAKAGASVKIISGPVKLEPPQGVEVINVKTAEQMLEACLSSLPADIMIACAAVCDFKPVTISNQKIKKNQHDNFITITMTHNPDILKIISNLKENRPKLVIGFAAETENLTINAINKLKSKKCDWILANNVGENHVFGSDENKIEFISSDKSIEIWEKSSKNDISIKLTKKIIDFFGKQY